MSIDWSVARRAVADSLPLFVPAVPFAFVIGLAVIDSGIDPFVGWSSSWLVFAGAAQLTLITLLGSGAAVIAAVTAALIVNARHVMYSAGLAPAFQRQPAWMRWLGPYTLLDQVFALAVLRLDDDAESFRTYYLAMGATFWVLWQITTALGLFIGPAIPEEWALGFAAPILFLGLVVIGIDHYPKAAAAVVGAGVTFLAAGLPSRSGLLVGAFAGIAAGTALERLRR